MFKIFIISLLWSEHATNLLLTLEGETILMILKQPKKSLKIHTFVLFLDILKAVYQFSRAFSVSSLSNGHWYNIHTMICSILLFLHVYISRNIIIIVTVMLSGDTRVPPLYLFPSLYIFLCSIYLWSSLYISYVLYLIFIFYGLWGYTRVQPLYLASLSTFYIFFLSLFFFSFSYLFCCCSN